MTREEFYTLVSRFAYVVEDYAKNKRIEAEREYPLAKRAIMTEFDRLTARVKELEEELARRPESIADYLATRGESNVHRAVKEIVNGRPLPEPPEVEK